MLALHLITITPDTAWVSRTLRVILLQEEIIFKFCEYLLIIPLCWPVRGLQKAVTLPEYLEIPQRVVIHSVAIHVELKVRRGVWSEYRPSLKFDFFLSFPCHLSDQHSMLTSDPTAATSLDPDIRGPRPSGWTEHGEIDIKICQTCTFYRFLCDDVH